MDYHNSIWIRVGPVIMTTTLLTASTIFLTFLTSGCTLSSPDEGIVSLNSSDQFDNGNEIGGFKADDQRPVLDSDSLLQRRENMVEHQLRRRGISDESVLGAMQSVLRHRFVPSDMINAAYEDRPLPIGHDQTISQPYIVALMTESVRPQPGEKALDVGTGSGYQAAVLAELVDQVYGIEIVEPLAKQAADRMTEMGYKNVTIRAGDGYRGWKEHAPFDIIIVAAAPEHIPQPLIEQLASGGRMIIPVGAGFQELILLEKLSDGSVRQSRIAAVRFVPMTGEAAGR